MLPPHHADLPTAPWDRLRAEFLEAILPQRCVVCGRYGSALHSRCLGRLPVAEAPRCLRCWRPGPGTWCARCAAGGPGAPAFDGLRTPFTFTGDARRALLEAKFRGVTALLDPLGRAASAVVPPEWGLDAVVPIPLGKRRRRTRGYNQSEVIARSVAAALGLPLRPRLLRRLRDTPPQATLDAVARSSNLRDAFEAVPVPGLGRVLLVDDVTTTGATFETAALALRAAGFRQIYALAIARED